MGKSNLAPVIDRLGVVKALMADLKAEENELKASLGDLDLGSYEGENFRLTITAPEREKLSDELKARIKEVVETFRDKLSPQYRTAHITREATPTFTVRARTGKALAA